MSAKVKTKVKKIANTEYSSMFNQMLGTGEECDMNVCYPKYQNIRDYSKVILDVIKIFLNSPVFKNPELQDHKKELVEILADQHQLFNSTFTFNDDLKALLDYNAMVSPEDNKRFSQIYTNIKTAKIVDFNLNMCNILILHNSSIADIKKLTYNSFINSAIPVNPFKGSKMDLKYMFQLLESQGKNAEPVIVLMLNIIHKLFNFSHKIYKEITSPDINVDDFANIIISSIGEIKNQVGRCDKAYKKIVESITMLKSNFNVYNRDFIETRNPTVFVENFILDVSKNVEADTEMISQFNKIIKFYREKTSKQSMKNPMMEKVFSALSDKMGELKRFTNISDFDENKGESPADKTPADLAKSTAEMDLSDDEAPELISGKSEE